MLVSINALATDYGRWLCKNCNFGVAGTSATQNETDARDFIAVNPVASNYIAGDTITICDGGSCIVLQFQAAGLWKGQGASFKDNQSTYKNGKVGGVNITNSGSSTDATSYETIAYGHWEWWDYYSDGKYIGSSEKVFIIDSFVVTYHNGANCIGGCAGSGNIVS